MQDARDERASPADPMWVASLVIAASLSTLLIAHGILKHRYSQEIKAAVIVAANDDAAYSNLLLAVSAAEMQARLADRNAPPVTIDPATLIVAGVLLQRRVDDSGTVEYWFTDPTTGGRARLMQSKAIGRPLEVQRHVQPGHRLDVPSGWLYQRLAGSCQAIFAISCLAWIALLAGFLLDYRTNSSAQRWLEVRRLLLVALIVAILSGLGLDRWQPLRDYIFPGGAWIGIAAVGLSLLAMWAVAKTSTSPSPGHCTQCGYNLTGNVSGICPECGTPVLSPP